MGFAKSWLALSVICCHVVCEVMQPYQWVFAALLILELFKTSCCWHHCRDWKFVVFGFLLVSTTKQKLPISTTSISNLFKLSFSLSKNILFRKIHLHRVHFHNFNFLSSFVVSIRTMVDQCCDIALVVVVTALLDKVLATSWRLVETSDQRHFLLEASNHFFSAVKPNCTVQLNSTVGLRVFRDFQGVAIVKGNCFAYSRTDSH